MRAFPDSWKGAEVIHINHPPQASAVTVSAEGGGYTRLFRTDKMITRCIIPPISDRINFSSFNVWPARTTGSTCNNSSGCWIVLTHIW